MLCASLCVPCCCKMDQLFASALPVCQQQMPLAAPCPRCICLSDPVPSCNHPDSMCGVAALIALHSNGHVAGRAGGLYTTIKADRRQQWTGGGVGGLAGAARPSLAARTQINRLATEGRHSRARREWEGVGRENQSNGNKPQTGPGRLGGKQVQGRGRVKWREVLLWR